MTKEVNINIIYKDILSFNVLSNDKNIRQLLKKIFRDNIEINKNMINKLFNIKASDKQRFIILDNNYNLLTVEDKVPNKILLLLINLNTLYEKMNKYNYFDDIEVINSYIYKLENNKICKDFINNMVVTKKTFKNIIMPSVVKYNIEKNINKKINGNREFVISCIENIKEAKEKKDLNSKNALSNTNTSKKGQLGQTKDKKKVEREESMHFEKANIFKNKVSFFKKNTLRKYNTFIFKNSLKNKKMKLKRKKKSVIITKFNSQLTKLPIFNLNIKKRNNKNTDNYTLKYQSKPDKKINSSVVPSKIHVIVKINSKSSTVFTMFENKSNSIKEKKQNIHNPVINKSKSLDNKKLVVKPNKIIETNKFEEKDKNVQIQNNDFHVEEKNIAIISETKDDYEYKKTKTRGNKEIIGSENINNKISKQKYDSDNKKNLSSDYIVSSSKGHILDLSIKDVYESDANIEYKNKNDKKNSNTDIFNNDLFDKRIIAKKEDKNRENHYKTNINENKNNDTNKEIVDRYAEDFNNKKKIEKNNKYDEDSRKEDEELEKKENQSIAYTIISPTNEILYHKEIKCKSPMSVIDLLIQSGLEVNNSNNFIESIGGISNEGMSGWIFEVNSAPVMVPASEYIVSPNEQIVWKYIDFSKVEKEENVEEKNKTKIKDKFE